MVDLSLPKYIHSGFYGYIIEGVQEMDRIIEYTTHLILNALYDVAVESTMDILWQ